MIQVWQLLIIVWYIVGAGITEGKIYKDLNPGSCFLIAMLWWISIFIGLVYFLSNYMYLITSFLRIELI
jgi:hypothetical protein